MTAKIEIECTGCGYFRGKGVPRFYFTGGEWYCTDCLRERTMIELERLGLRRPAKPSSV